MLQTLRDHGRKHRLLYPAKLSINIDGENKIFHNKTRFKQYISTNPALQKVLERKLQPKEANWIPNQYSIFLENGEIKLPQDPAIPLLSIYPKDAQ